MKPLDMDALRENPLEVLVVFTDAVKEYAEKPDDYDLRCRVLLLGGFVAGMAMRDIPREMQELRGRLKNAEDALRVRLGPIPHTAGCLCARCEQRPKRPGPRG